MKRSATWKMRNPVLLLIFVGLGTVCAILFVVFVAPGAATRDANPAAEQVPMAPLPLPQQTSARRIPQLPPPSPPATDLQPVTGAGRSVSLPKEPSSP